MLEIGKGDHREQRVMMQAQPAAALKVIEPQFLLQLLMDLLADPTRFDRPGQRQERGPRRMIGQVVFLLARGAPFADEPGRVPGEVPPAGHARPIGDAHSHGREFGDEQPFGPAPPRHFAKHSSTRPASTWRNQGLNPRLGRDAGCGRHGMLLGSPHGPLARRDEGHVGRIDVLRRIHADGPAEAAGVSPARNSGLLP